MTPSTLTASETAQRMWARATNGTTAADEVGKAAERMCTQLRSELGRWIGAEGYRVLLDRAVDLTRAEYPGLNGLSYLGANGSGPPAAASSRKPAQVAAGMVALMAALIELLGRIVGDEMAVRLVEQSATPSPREVGSVKSNGGLDG